MVIIRIFGYTVNVSGNQKNINLKKIDLIDPLTGESRSLAMGSPVT